MNDRVLLDIAQKRLAEWEKDAEEKAKPGKPKEYEERYEEQMQSHGPEMAGMLPGLQERLDQLSAEREIYEDDDIGPSSNESNDEWEELGDIISTFEMYAANA